MNKILILPIKKKWFDMIVSKKKKEEYREIKKYYISRFKKYDCFIDNKKPVFKVMFRNGYSSKSPYIICKCTLNIGYGKEEWGAEKNNKYYILNILNIENIEYNQIKTKHGFENKLD